MSKFPTLFKELRTLRHSHNHSARSLSSLAYRHFLHVSVSLWRCATHGCTLKRLRCEWAAMPRSGVQIILWFSTECNKSFQTPVLRFVVQKKKKKEKKVTTHEQKNRAGQSYRSSYHSVCPCPCSSLLELSITVWIMLPSANAHCSSWMPS